MTATFIIGDCIEMLRTLPDASVDLVFSSPPFLALRSYLPPDHPDKSKEIGSEPTPGEFIDALLDVVEELSRVLTPHGSLCFELGDTYSGSGGAGGDYGNPDKTNSRGDAPTWSGSGAAHRRSRRRDQMAGIIPESQRKGRNAMDNLTGWPMDKSLTLIPETFRFALAQGFNPLSMCARCDGSGEVPANAFVGGDVECSDCSGSGHRLTPRWRVRNVVRWHRPNPPVGSLGDKFRPATSEVAIACKSRTRYFDLDGVRQPASQGTHQRLAKGASSRPNDNKTSPDGNRDTLAIIEGDGTAPPLDTWIIPTAPYKGSHYATFPPALVVKPLLSMCPERVCTTCGEPSRRIVETERVRQSDGTVDPPRVPPTTYDGGGTTAIGIRHAVDSIRTTVGWTDCGHDSWRPGIVLDPFAGSGTVLAVASGHGRDSIGIDLDERNAELARTRVGMFLTVVQPDMAYRWDAA